MIHLFAHLMDCVQELITVNVLDIPWMEFVAIQFAIIIPLSILKYAQDTVFALLLILVLVKQDTLEQTALSLSASASMPPLQQSAALKENVLVQIAVFV